MKTFEIRLGEAVIDDRHAAVAALAASNSIERRAVVRAMAGGLDNDGALDPENAMQLLQRFERRVGRRVGAPCRVGKPVGWAKDMAMRISGPRRCLELRRLGVGIRPLARFHSPSPNLGMRAADSGGFGFVAIAALLDHLLGLSRVAPAHDPHPFPIFEVLVVLEEVLDLLERDRRQIRRLDHTVVALR